VAPKVGLAQRAALANQQLESPTLELSGGPCRD
jgi:hypothetical protein